MDTPMQEMNSASGGATASMTVSDRAKPEGGALETLREELAKWQARVPKLASALRERTSEVEALKAQLRNLEGPAAGAQRGSNQSSGIRARDALIGELEARVSALGGKVQDAEGQLRARDLEIGQLRQEASEWRDKWQALSTTLDERADGIEQKDRELKRLQKGLDELLALQEGHKGRIKEQDLELTGLRERASSLESRNQNLFETTELANRQIETLGESLERLRGELKAARQSLAAQEARSGGGMKELEALEAAEEEKTALGRRLEERDAEVTALTERLVELDAEVARLKDCVATADEATSRFEAERRALSEQLDEVRRRNQHLEAQLSERSSLVVGLEREKSDISSRTSSLQAENRRLTETLEKARQAAAGNADHIAQVDDRLERQKQLMENLEAELADVQEEYAEAVKTHQRVLKEKETEIAALKERMDDAGVAALKAVASRVPDEGSGDNAQLQAEVIKLEGMVRERTEQLNKLRWQQDMLEKQRDGDPSEDRMLMVLNQQLQAAREENGRLRETLRQLEAAGGGAVAPAGCADDHKDRDDLSQIRGIGTKLVKQLRRQGITRFDQIATLSESDLDDPKHPLHGMKGRVVKDDWIGQAAKLGGL